MNGTGSIRAALGIALTMAAAPMAAAEDERQAVFERYLDFAALVKGGSIEPNWLADGSSFWFAAGGPADRVIWHVDPAADSVEPLFDVPRLRAAIGEAIGHAPPYAGVPFETFQLTPDGATASFALEGGRFSLDMATYKVEAQPAPGATPAANVRRTIEFRVGPEGEEKVTLGKWDTFSCPPGAYRGFRNVGEDNAVLLTVITGAVDARDDVCVPPSVGREIDDRFGGEVLDAFRKLAKFNEE